MEARDPRASTTPSTEGEPPVAHGRGLAVTLWAVAVLIAEIEFWSWVFQRAYG